jgi:hypothetical protein
MHHSRFVINVLILAFLFFAGSPVFLFSDGDSGPTEYQVKAAFLYYFVKFVEWPADLPDPITICVLGEDPFGPVLERTIKGKQVGGKHLSIKRSRDLANLNSCQILFVSSSEKDRFPEIFDTLGNAAILTVGDTDDFSQLGGIINFFIEENKVHFEINLNAASGARLKISSKLLNVARVERY